MNSAMILASPTMYEFGEVLCAKDNSAGSKIVYANGV